MDQNLMQKIYNWQNLLEAWYRVEDNEGCAGIDGVTIDKFDLDLSDNLASIQNELMSQSYKPDPLLRFYVEKENAEKRPYRQGQGCSDRCYACAESDIRAGVRGYQLRLSPE